MCLGGEHSLPTYMVEEVSQILLHQFRFLPFSIQKMIEEWFCTLIEQVVLKLLIPTHLMQHHQDLHCNVYSLFLMVVPKHFHAQICHSFPQLVEECLPMVVKLVPRDKDLQDFDSPSHQIVILKQPEEEGFSAGVGTCECPHESGAIDRLIVYQKIDESRYGIALPFLVYTIDNLFQEEAGKSLSLKYQWVMIECEFQRDIFEELQYDFPCEQAVLCPFPHEHRVQLEQSVVEKHISTEVPFHLDIILALKQQPRDCSQGSFDCIFEVL